MPAVEHIPNAPDPPARATTQATEHKKAGLGQTVNARFEPACTPARAPGGRQQLTLRQHVDTPHRRTRKPPPRAAEARREIRRHDVAPRTQRRTATRAPAARAKPARPVTNATRTDVHGRQTGTERENQARAPRAALATRSPASPEDAIRRPPRAQADRSHRQSLDGARRTGTPRRGAADCRKKACGTRDAPHASAEGNTNRTSRAVTTQRSSRHRHRAIKPQSPRHCLARTNLAATSTGRTHRSKTQGATAVSHDAEKIAFGRGIRTHACTRQSKRYVSGWECSRRRRRHTCAPGGACERACTTTSPRAPYCPTKGSDGRCVTSCGQSDASVAKAPHNVRC